MTDALAGLVDATLALALALSPDAAALTVEQRVRTWRQALRVGLLGSVLRGQDGGVLGRPGHVGGARTPPCEVLVHLAAPTRWFAAAPSADHLDPDTLAGALRDVGVGDDWFDALPHGLALEDVGRLLAPALQHAAEWHDSITRRRGGLQRKQRGTYYTPPRLIAALLDELDAIEVDAPPRTLCDPACGTGALLLPAVQRLVDRGLDPDDALRRVHGVDIDPLAVELCRLTLHARFGRDSPHPALVEQIVVGNALVGRPPSGVEAPPAPPGTAPFHWPQRLPQLAAQGGFDLVLANPPWMRIKAQARQVLRATLPDAARAAHRAEREHTLDAEAPALREALSRRRDVSRALSSWLRTSGCFPHSAHGDINTFALFSERCWQLVAPGGRVGLIVPTGLATDHGHRRLFTELVEHGALHTLLDFENRKRLFPGVDSRFRFSLVALHRPTEPERTGLQRVATWLHDPDDRHDAARVWSLPADTLAICNPESQTLPMFRSAHSARRGIGMQQRMATLGAGPWQVELRRMFDMTNDADAFVSRDALEGRGAAVREDPRHGMVIEASATQYVPLYEGKLFWQHQGAFATFAGQSADDRRRGRAVELAPFDAVAEPRFWVEAARVEARVEPERVGASFWLCIRALTNPSNQRTLVAALVPPCAVGNSALVVDSPLATSPQDRRHWLPLLCANLNALVLDDLARQKMGNTNVNMYMLRQLPVLSPGDWETAPWPGAPPLGALVAPRALALAASCRPLARLAATPVWGQPVTELTTLADRERASAEIDALIAHGYGLGEADLRHILHPPKPEVAFGALERAERAAHGRFVTAERVLEAFTTMRDWAT